MSGRAQRSLHATTVDNHDSELLEELLLLCFIVQFETQIGLQPMRSRCHQIRLLLMIALVVVRPYRYAHT
jgi:hypothetical protein